MEDNVFSCFYFNPVNFKCFKTKGLKIGHLFSCVLAFKLNNTSHEIGSRSMIGIKLCLRHNNKMFDEG